MTFPLTRSVGYAVKTETFQTAPKAASLPGVRIVDRVRKTVAEGQTDGPTMAKTLLLQLLSR